MPGPARPSGASVSAASTRRLRWAADGKIFLLSESGETIVLRAGRTPQVVARNKIAGRTLASPAISGGRIFLRTDDQVIAVGT